MFSIMLSQKLYMQVVSYNSLLFPRRLSIKHKDRFYAMFQESECAKEETCEGAGEEKSRHFTNIHRQTRIERLFPAQLP